MAKKKAPKMTPVAVALLAAVSAAVEEGLLTTEQLVSELGLEAPEAEEKPAKGKGKKAAKEEAPAKGKGAKGKGKKAVEEDDEDEDEDDEEEGDDAPDFDEMNLKQMKAFVKENELEVPKAVLKDEDELREWLEENYESDEDDEDEDEDDEDSDDDEDGDDEDEDDEDEDDEDW